MPMIDLISIGPKKPTRQPSDLLPYIRRHKDLFSPLVGSVDKMALQVLKVPLNEIDCITKTVIKVTPYHWLNLLWRETDSLSRLVLTKYRVTMKREVSMLAQSLLRFVNPGKLHVGMNWIGTDSRTYRFVKP